MSKQPEQSIEHNKYLEFTQTAEYKKITQSEYAIFPAFDDTSANDLHKMRDYIYEQIPEVQRKISFKDYDSPRLSQMQIGQALIAREEYQSYKKQHPVHIEKSNTQATTGSYGHVGKIYRDLSSYRLRG